MAAIRKRGPVNPGRTVEMDNPVIEAKTQTCRPEAASDAEEAVKSHQETILPLALRDEEITTRDIETLMKIAEVKSATVGRLRRAPKAIRSVEPSR